MLSNHFLRKSLVLLILFIFVRGDLSAQTTILFTSNINGTLQNCGCGTDPLGGIGRIKHVKDSLASESSDIIFVDGGDYLNSYPYPELDHAMIEASRVLNFDFIVPGDQEFIKRGNLGKEFIEIYSGKLLLSNAESPYKNFIQVHNNTNIIFYGFLSPNFFDFVDIPEMFELSSDLTMGYTANGSLFQVIIVHGFLEDARSCIESNPAVDLVLLSHDQRKGIWEHNGIKIVGNGKDSEYISLIKLELKEEWQIDINQLKMRKSIPEDDQILRIIQEFKENS